MRRPSATLLALILVGLIPGCRPTGPRPIALGTEPCARCHMTIDDPRFSAETVTATGKAIVFDDVGCLVTWLASHPEPAATAWVTSFVDQTNWLDARAAVYLQSDSLRTPMSSGLLALRPGHEADSVQARLGGRLLPWVEVRNAAGPPAPSPAS